MTNSNPIHVAIADDHQLFREGLTLIIGSNQDFKLVLEADNGQILLDRIEKLEQKPDVILLDLKMPVKDGMETLRELKENYPDVKVLILTMLDEDDYILHLLDMGASGYLLKNSSAEEVITAIKTVAEKDFYFNDHISKIMLRGLRKKRKTPPALNNSTRITEREQEVLELLCHEMTTSEIAEKLFVSVRTVETHRKHLMEKLEAKNTAGIIYRAVKEGLVN